MGDTEGGAAASMAAGAGKGAGVSEDCQALVPYKPTESLARARAWAAHSAGERRRRAVAACQARDEAELSALLTESTKKSGGQATNSVAGRVVWAGQQRGYRAGHVLSPS